MMGRTHALTGAAAAGVLAVPAAPVAGLSAGELVLGTVVAAGAAMLPDIDHPGSGISRTFGPVTRGFAWLVRWVCGGHRKGAHSLAGVGVLALVVFGAAGLHAGDPWWAVAGLGLAVALAAAGAGVAGLAAGRPGRGRAYRRRWHGRAAGGVLGTAGAGIVVAAVAAPRAAGAVLLGAVLVLTLAAAARVVRIRGDWDDLLPVPVAAWLVWSGTDLRVVPGAVLLGVLVHLGGDAVTRFGVPFGWPWSQARWSADWFTTGAEVERRVVVPVCGVVLTGTAAWNTGLIAALL